MDNYLIEIPSEENWSIEDVNHVCSKIPDNELSSIIYMIISPDKEISNLPSNLVFYFTCKSVNINGYLLLYNLWILREGASNNYLVNWKTGKSVLIFKDWNKYQKVINKNINNLQSLLDLYNGDNECVMLANAILGVDTYVYTMRNIIAKLI